MRAKDFSKALLLSAIRSDMLSGNRLSFDGRPISEYYLSLIPPVNSKLRVRSNYPIPVKGSPL